MSAAAEKKRLGPEDWVAAARTALIEGGPSAVAVEPLAKRMGVTKGSFYWHFKDRPALLSALLSEWERRTTEMFAQSPGETALDRFAKLGDLQASGAESAFEAAIRGWALSDDQVSEVVRATDARRAQYIEGLFHEIGATGEYATALARLMVVAAAGEMQMAALGEPTPPSTIATLVRLMARFAKPGLSPQR